MKQVTSRDNADYRLLQRVLAGRRAPGERSGDSRRIALEGVHLCQSWLEFKGQPELAFFDGERLSHPEIAGLLRAVGDARVRICSSTLLRGVSQVVQGQGVIFIASAPQPEVPLRLRNNCLWLDRIQDPGNMGTLLRTAAAAGMREIFASTACVAAWSGKVLRSAQGAHFVLDIHEGQDLNALTQRLDIPLLATALEAAHPLYDTELPESAAWVFGNEGQGVAPALLARADLRLFIPHDAAVESLNVAVAAGICLFEQRRKAGGPRS
ncbi:MAG: RNA methyltransferase [Burkholderiaceae bacterium]